MAERIVSPGVFTRERDLSFLPQGIADIGACIIGPTLKGPAFVPTQISNFPEFEEMFGTTTKDYYTPYAVEQYLRSAGTVTIVRILNTSGYSADSLAITTGTTTAAKYGNASISMSRMSENDVFAITGSDGTKFKFTAVDLPLPADEPSANSYYFLGSGSLVNNREEFKNRIQSMSIQINAATGIPVSTSVWQPNVSHSVNLVVTASLSGTGGNSISFKSGSTSTSLAGGAAAIGGKVLAVLVPSRGGSSGTADLEGSTIIGNWESASLTLSGSNWGAKSLTADGSVNKYSFSFNTGSSNASYIEDVFSRDAQVQKSGQNTVAAYLYKNYKYVQTTSGYSASNTVSVVDGTLGLGITYQNAATPAIQSQTLNGGRYSLFAVKSRSHGSDVNNKYKIVISNIKKAGSVAGSDYGTFSLQVRQTGLNDNNLTKDNILEQWDGLNFDPTSPNYFARRIGDRYVTIDANGKLTYNGDWPNLSKYIYVSDYSEIANNEIPKSLVPMGHASINNPHGSDDSTVPAWTFKATQSNAQGEFDSAVLYGVDYANADAEEYLAPHNSFGNGSNTTMSLEDFNGHADASTLGTTYSDGTEKITLDLSHIKQRKFVVPFQGGFDGSNPAVPKYTGANIVNTNTQGFDCSTSSTGGSVSYKKAINAISNADEFDINMLITPGIIHGLHSKITNHAIAKCEARGDAFYVLDCGIHGGTIASAVNTISALDTNYAATYYPWVKIVDRNTSLPVWVPPSVVLPGVIAYTDKVAHEWFAPAGLNRGGLTTVLEAQTRLTHSERDELYEDRVNPIASFPGQGVVVWGQKTLQARPSALDRVNVRRLLIRLKKFIASSSRYLVFEQNTTATRNRFLNIVNPFLESVQSNSGLSAFRVVMDDTNNTPDVVDRNQLVGQIFIQPTRTAEFIVLDFVVLPTGATFPE
jgi:hypothetical protein